MKTEKELIEDCVNDPNLSEKYKTIERAKLAICNQCPSTNKCFSCGCHEWWIEPKSHAYN